MVYLFVGNITDFYDGCLIILKILISLTTIKRKKGHYHITMAG